MNNNTWIIEHHTTTTSRGGKIAGTTVTLNGRTMKWAGRMTKKQAIEQTLRFWKNEDTLAAFAAKTGRDWA